MPYIHNFLTRDNGHRILISDIQLLQWFFSTAQYPHSVVRDVVIDLLANREIPVTTRTGVTQLLITPAQTDAGTPTNPPTPAVIQHVVPSINEPVPTQSPSRPRTALLPIPPPASIRRDSRTRARTISYKPHVIRAVSAALREIMDRQNPSSPIFPNDNDSQPSDTDIMRS
jgi:hypothetical protein